MMFFAALFFP